MATPHPNSITTSIELGELLLNAGMITGDQLDEALRRQKRGEGKIGQILVRIGAVVDEEAITNFVGKQLNIGAIRLSDIELNPEIVKLIPQDIARKFNVIAVSKLGRTLVVAISDPSNIYVLDAIKFITGHFVQPVISPEASITKAVEYYYGGQGGLDEVIKGLGETEIELVETDEEIADLELQSLVQDKPLVKLVDSIIADAIKMKASDIHLECYEKRIRVRYRVDGELQEMSPIPFKYRAAIISRVKIMAELDISERRLPQDGRIKVKMQDRPIDLRVSVLPTIFGEKVVMRILDPRGLMVDLTKLGFPEPDLKIFDSAIHLPYGIILVTGPTGSGKTTTLYSALKTLNTVNVNIMTAEDPVEFNFEGINQVAVRSNIGLTFAAALRSFLRQDPDIIMVGEIRDEETGEIAVKAALTGHLVFSTLHTNDAPSTILRMIDMGIPDYLVASATKLIMAQRMIKKICSECKYELKDKPEGLLKLGLTAEEIDKMTIYAGRGCKECNNTGYSGRTGLFEVMPITPQLERLIVGKSSTAEIREQAIKEGMVSLRDAGIEKIRKGITTWEEVLGETAG
ncbi:MAG: type IV-A pilus assembly ATPase PilB [candidate division Zixibacteria bacterium CG_4_9_14_3_um_filter_46_8]|nr:MAG: type IV-A pilus assembly ATPase PilB [candidate division Zixibacteria bacterium CG_4_9_14_3_um_filter_46_8]